MLRHGIQFRSMYVESSVTAIPSDLLLWMPRLAGCR